VLPQVKLVMASKWVGAHLAAAGVVGTWFGTGLPDLSSREGSAAMSLRIENNSMSLELDGHVLAMARFSEYAAADGQGRWIVLTAPRRLFSRNQAITALTMVGFLPLGHSTNTRTWPRSGRSCRD
jgi:hypothetical protein